ncbi:beta-lactamase-like protein [Kalaharituber pfeilii]|nr:beta-lactamase-like protein [Kalaharituber pfeilii]
MQIKSIPMWSGTGDNYAYLIVDDKTRDAMIIDPAHPPEVLPILNELIDKNAINFKGILNTHHHHDHSGGNKTLLEAYPSITILGGKNCPHISRGLSHNEKFTIGDSITIEALHTPCHTKDSICYYVVDGEDKAVFTGDTLFIAGRPQFNPHLSTGCGRFFEGTPAEMHHALNTVLSSLPDDTRVYPGHEYTKSNVKFALSVLDSPDLRALSTFCDNPRNKETQGRFTIGDEKKHNVFMRVTDPAIQSATGKSDPIDVMGKLREMKNAFK